MNSRPVGIFTAAMAVLAVTAVVYAAAALWTRAPSLPESFTIEFAALVVIAALTRRFGITLPGKGVASFLLGVMLFALVNHGWPSAIIVALLGLAIGDVALRHLKVRIVWMRGARVIVGTALAGVIYEAIGGIVGSGALQLENLGPLVVLTILLALVTNGLFYFDLFLKGVLEWVDSLMLARWEAIAYFFSVSLALAWTAVIGSNLPTAPAALFAAILLASTAAAWYIIVVGVRADELRMVQRLAHAVAAEMSLSKSFEAIKKLTAALLPWEQMRLLRYLPDRHEMEVVEDTASESNAGFRYPADRGLTGETLRVHRPVVSNALNRHQVTVPGGERAGSEIWIPLYRDDELAGLWRVRHSDPTIYSEADGDLLNLLAPQLALSLSLTTLIDPMTAASDQVSDYFAQLTSTSEELHTTGQKVAAAATRAEDGAASAAELIAMAVREAANLEATAQDVARAGGETLTEAEQTEQAAQQLRTATQEAVGQLRQLADAVDQGTSDMAQLREAAEEVERFAESIAGIAYQTNLLALNATIESARAGAQGRGFGVVAEEVRKLAEASSRETQKVTTSVEATRRALDRAVVLLERVRTGMTSITTGSAAWLIELDRIVAAAEETARAGRRIADLAAANRACSTEIGGSLGEAERAAKASALEAQSMAAVANEQLRSVEELTQGANRISTLADQLRKATQFNRPDGAP